MLREVIELSIILFQLPIEAVGRKVCCMRIRFLIKLRK